MDHLDAGLTVLGLIRNGLIDSVQDEVLLIGDNDNTIFYAGEIAPNAYHCVTIRPLSGPAVYIDQLTATPGELRTLIRHHFAGLRIYWDTAAIVGPLYGLVSATGLTAPSQTVAGKHLLGWCQGSGCNVSA